MSEFTADHAGYLNDAVAKVKRRILPLFIVMFIVNYIDRVNISFIKEVTLSVAPQDIALTPQAEQEVSSFLESALQLIDPIMRFFSGLGSSWSAPSEQDIIHA